MGSASGRNQTRRAFLGGAATVGAGGLLAGPLRGASAAATDQCVPMAPGIRTGAIAVTPSGRTVWTTDTTDTTITAHRTRDLQRGRSIDVGGAPIAIAIAPDAAIALVVTAFYHHPGLAIVDLVTGEVVRLDVGPDPRAVAFAPDGRSAYVAGGAKDGTLRRVEPAKRRVHAPIDVGAQPRDVVVLPHGKHVLVSLNAESAVALVSGKRVRRIATAQYPHHLAVSGTRALVTHNGAGERRVTLLDLERRRVRRRFSAGFEPAGVAFKGTKALITTTGKLAIIDVRTGKRRTRTVSRAPRAVCVAGTRAIVADAVTGQLTKVRT